MSMSHSKCRTCFMYSLGQHLKLSRLAGINLTLTSAMVVITIELASTELIVITGVGAASITINILIDYQIDTRLLVDVRTIADLDAAIIICTSICTGRSKSASRLNCFCDIITDITQSKHLIKYQSLIDRLCIANGLIVKRLTCRSRTNHERHATVEIINLQKLTGLLVTKNETVSIYIAVFRRFRTATSTIAIIIIKTCHNYLNSFMYRLFICLMSVHFVMENFFHISNSFLFKRLICTAIRNYSIIIILIYFTVRCIHVLIRSGSTGDEKCMDVTAFCIGVTSFCKILNQFINLLRLSAMDENTIILMNILCVYQYKERAQITHRRIIMII
nr:MAG TPA: hypothetical protein [Caudoviricetes sp.]